MFDGFNVAYAIMSIECVGKVNTKQLPDRKTLSLPAVTWTYVRIWLYG